MTERKLNNWMKSYLEYDDNSEAPYLYRVWSSIFTIAAALERNVWLKWDRVLYPNFYIVLVGPSGVRKGSALYPSERILKAASVNFIAEAITREALIQDMAGASKVITNPETGESTDSSPISIFSKEFTVFLGYNNPQLIMDLTDFYDCADSWQYKTKNKGTDTINGVWLNLIGATTPSQLQTSLPIHTIGGGLSSRMIFIFEEKKERIVPFPSGIRWEDDREKGVISFKGKLEEDLVNDLMIMKQTSGEFTFANDFREAWENWYVFQEFHPRYTSTFLEPFETRRATHILKLCMIMNINRDGNMLITKNDLTQAINLLDSTEKKMPYTFRGIGQGEDSYIVGKVTSHLIAKGRTDFNDLLGVLINDTTEIQLFRVVGALVRSGIIKQERNIESGKLYLSMIKKDIEVYKDPVA